MLPGSFTIARIPRILFGEGSITQVPKLAQSYGEKALLVTGRRSFRESRHWKELHDGLGVRGMSWETASVEEEPSPQMVDDTVSQLRNAGIDVVIGVGGGATLDTAKAIAGLLRVEHSVLDFLEGVGRGVRYKGPAVPSIAVPTTAGTGSEATRNSVLSQRGQGGFKRSFRHEALVPQFAVVDPTLLETCPPDVIAADGMDATTQLIESYTSSRSNPVTDALALSGLEAARDGLWEWHSQGPDSAAGRRKMAYAALMSGIALAQTGLGAVHGLASPLGAYFPISHGVVCGTLVAAATDVNIRALAEREPHNPAMWKYAHLGRLLAGVGDGDEAAQRIALVGLLNDWTERLALPRLSIYGVRETHFNVLVQDSRGSSMKTNPIALDDDEIAEILRRRL
jgi:alcohol dehydrogenase